MTENPTLSSEVDATPSGEFTEWFPDGPISGMEKRGSADETEVQTRLRMLERIIASARFGGNAAEFARAAGVSQSQISDMRKGKKSFGDKVARKMERQAGLPKYYFEDVSDWPFSIDRSLFDSLTPEQKSAVETAMLVALSHVKGVPDEETRKSLASGGRAG